MDTLAKKAVTWRRNLHKIPEIGFHEVKTQQYLLDQLHEMPQGRMHIQTWRTGIFVYIPGVNPTKTIGYRADMDGLPIEEQTGLPFASEHEGFMHACGHDMHMAIGLATVHYLLEQPIEDNVLVLFQPAEEGPGGAEPMMENEWFQRYRPDELYALHIAPEYPVGTVATKQGLLFANTSELFIELTGRGGHAAYPHLANDMVIALSHLVIQLQTVISRNVDPLDAAVITVGKLQAGRIQNVIAEQARLDGTIRTRSAETMALVKKRIEAIVQGIEAAFNCKAKIDYGCMYHQVWNAKEQAEAVLDAANETSGVQGVLAKEAMTGEDFGYMIRDIPGCMFWLGVQSVHGLHEAKLDPNEAAISVAIQTLQKLFQQRGNR
ncbi:N-acetyldiaminopimelate deacetylase [Bacillus fonticola]|uniref:N-acetyldiaminopimelate deacetylase n=1 Tax=Bacillus fonticola TaxID=2728853 RepID=UPI001475B3B9|nr:N-acetyldiaminopimelate deacetylase [Bacillus fonticola]